jgi:hypothetical protein
VSELLSLCVIGFEAALSTEIGKYDRADAPIGPSLSLGVAQRARGTGYRPRCESGEYVGGHTAI